MKTLPVIGSKFVGPNSYYNSATKEYWSVLPSLSKEEVKLQKALLKPVPRIPSDREVLRESARTIKLALGIV